MTIHTQATYRDGALHLPQPLGIPNNTDVSVIIVPSRDEDKAEILASRPKSPRFTSAELHRILAENAVHVGSLPPDFSREDIYSDHD